MVENPRKSKQIARQVAVCLLALSLVFPIMGYYSMGFMALIEFDYVTPDVFSNAMKTCAMISSILAFIGLGLCMITGIYSLESIKKVINGESLNEKV